MAPDRLIMIEHARCKGGGLMRRTRGAVLAVVLAGGCMKNEPRKDAAAGATADPGAAGATAIAGPVRVTTSAEIQASEGQRVRVRGAVFHEKLGDGVEVDGLAILCPDLRLPDGVTEASLEGRLERWSPPVAETNARGEISQGVVAGTRRWILRDCQAV